MENSIKNLLLLLFLGHSVQTFAQSPHITLFGSIVGSELAGNAYGGGLGYEVPLLFELYFGGDVEYWQGTQTIESAGESRQVKIVSKSGDLFIKHYVRVIPLPDWFKPYASLGFGRQILEASPKDDLPIRDGEVGLGASIGAAFSVDYSSYFIDYRYRSFGDETYDSINIGLSSFVR